MSYLSNYSVSVAGAPSPTPYLNTTIETGYFYYSNPLQTIVSSNYYSLKTALTTSNGLITTLDTAYGSAPTASTAGFRVNSPGVYRLQLALDNARVTDGDRQYNQRHGLGTTYLSNVVESSLDVSSFFGGNSSNYSYTIGTNNSTDPGIISWTFNSYTNTTTATAQCIALSKYNLALNFSGRGNSSGQENPYFCTSTIVFSVKDPSKTIYFQYQNQLGFKFGFTPFTLELLSTQPLVLT